MISSREISQGILYVFSKYLPTFSFLLYNLSNMEQSFCFLHVFGSEKQERKEAHAHTDTVWFRLHLRDQIKMGLQIQGKDHIMTKKIKSSLWTAGMLILFGVMLSLTRYGDSSAAEMTSGSVRSSSSHNPIMDHKFGADPFVMTYNGRVYVYMTNDSHCYDQTPKDANGRWPQTSTARSPRSRSFLRATSSTGLTTEKSTYQRSLHGRKILGRHPHAGNASTAKTNFSFTLRTTQTASACYRPIPRSVPLRSHQREAV